MKKALTFTALAALAFGLISTGAQATPKIGVQSIIVNPVPTKLSVRVWVDRDQSGSRTPTYNIGEPITLFTSVNENAYIYLFNVNPDGSTDQIYPNMMTGNQLYVRAGTTRAFPERGSNFKFNVGGPSGLNRVLAIASRRPLNLSELSEYSGSGQFASVNAQNPQDFAQALSIVVNPVTQPIPQTDWTSDTAYFNAR